MEKIGEYEVNRIYQEDCLKGMTKIPNDSIDLIVTDPPYNTGMKAREFPPNTYQRVKLDGFFNDDYTDEDYFNLVNNCSKEFYRILKQDKPIYVYMSWKKTGLWIDLLEKAGFSVKNVIVWDKVVHGLNYQNYAYTHEFIIYAIKGKYQVKNKGIEDSRNGRFKDVWSIQRETNTSQEEGHHETQKLLKVVKLPIKHGSEEGDLVFDPFMGSGTTAVASKELNRRYLGFEIDGNYINISNNRLKQEGLFNYADHSKLF
jgi:DNA modification methylase